MLNLTPEERAECADILLDFSTRKLASLGDYNVRYNFASSIETLYLRLGPGISLTDILTEQEELAQFEENQKIALQAMEEHARTLQDETDLSKFARAISQQHLAIGKARDAAQTAGQAVKRWVFQHPERESFAVVRESRLMLAHRYIPDIYELDYIDDRRTAGDYLSKTLSDHHDVDITGGQVFGGWWELVATREERDSFQELLKARKAERKNKTKYAGPVDPKDIVIPKEDITDGVRGIFDTETVRPKRGDRREEGGRAGLGPQKPDLWTPKNE